MLLLEAGTRRHGHGAAAGDAEDARAEDAEVGVLVEVGDGDAQRLRAAHREAGDRAALAAGEDAVGLLDVGHDVGLEVGRELVDRRPGRAGVEGEGPGVARGHDDDHRLRLAGRDEVVEDEPGPADGPPGVVAVPSTVQQVEHRVALRARLVAGRRVDVHPPKALEGGRVVRDRGDRAVRHRLRVHEVRPGHVDEAPGVLVRLAGRRVARVDDRHAVHVEVVAPGARRERDRDFPDAFRALGKRPPAGGLHRDRRAVRRDVAEEADGLRLRRQDPEGHAPVRRDLGRRDARALRHGEARRRSRRVFLRLLDGGLRPRGRHRTREADDGYAESTHAPPLDHHGDTLQCSPARLSRRSAGASGIRVEVAPALAPCVALAPWRLGNRHGRTSPTGAGACGGPTGSSLPRREGSGHAPVTPEACRIGRRFAPRHPGE